MSPTQQPWFVAEGLRKDFHGVTAIGDADLSLASGEVRGVVGPNGAGKSTLMQMIAGFHQPDAGRILVDDREVRLRAPEDALRHGIALVPQETLLAPHLTVAENVVLGREPRRWGATSGRESRRAARMALERLGAPVDPERPVHDLDPAERRMVMIARALLDQPRLLVLDEPTAALGPGEAAVVLDLVRRLAATQVSILYVTHRFDDLEAVADTVTGVREARVVADLAGTQVTRAELVRLVDPGERSGAGPRERTSAHDRVVLDVRGLSGGPLRTLDLTVHSGEVVGIAGLAGSGADEAVAMLGAVQRPTAGTVSVEGTSLRLGDRRQAVRHGVAYVPGDRALATLPHHDVAANMTLVQWEQLASRGVARPRRERELADGLAQQVDLRGRIDGPIEDLSGGNQQKAIFARWSSTTPRVLLLHDPTAGVDVGARAQLHSLVADLAAAGAAVVVVSTDLAEIVDLADRVVVIDRGTVTAELPRAGLDEGRLLDAMTSGTASSTHTPSAVPKESTHV